MKIELEDYLINNPDKKALIAEVFYKTDCFMFAGKKNGKEEYYLKKDELNNEIYLEFNKLYILIENDSYLIYEIEKIVDNDYEYSEFNEDLVLKLRKKNYCILVWAIMSFTKNNGYASKNIDKLLNLAKIKNLEIIVDTYTKELIHLSNKKGLYVLRKDAVEAFLNN